MLQETQRTSAPSAVSVSISTAVWIVIWSEPMIFAPASGCDAANSSRVFIRPGISCSARRISLRPYSASARSATLKSSLVGAVVVMVLLEGFSGSGGSGELEQALVLLLLPPQPVAGRHVLRAPRGRLEPALHRFAQILV